jgi:hypothetical protein
LRGIDAPAAPLFSSKERSNFTISGMPSKLVLFETQGVGKRSKGFVASAMKRWPVASLTSHNNTIGDPLVFSSCSAENFLGRLCRQIR